MKFNTQLSLIFATTGLLGFVIVFNALVFWPTIPAFTVDAVLTTEEVKNPKLREVVTRTAEHKTSFYPSTIYAVLGGFVVITSTIGLVRVRRNRAAETMT